MKDKKDELIKSISEYYFSIFMSLSCIQFMAYFICVMLKKSTLILHVTPITLLWIIYIYFKDVIDNAKEKKLSFLMLKIDTVIFLVALLNDGILSVFNKIAVNNPGLLKEAIIVVLLVDFMTFLISIVALLNDTVKEKLDMIHEIDTKNLLSGKSSEEEIKPGDAVIGYGIEDNKPVILPLKDRYLHMLIIGPTGSGKTSQSVIPMINRDMTNPDIGITVLEPKGDLAEKIFAMAKYYNREVLYFNPILPDCPYFNPLFGLETDVIENMATTFKMLNPDSSQFFLDMNENTIRKALKILKRLKGDDATLLDLDTLLNNTGGQGRKMVMDFSKLQVPNPSVARENSDIAQWFLNDYYSGLSGERGATKTFEHCSGLRSQVAKLTSNEFLRRVLNPPPGESANGINFDDALERGTVITMATAQGKLRDLGRYLGYFIILQLQASVFRRPGNENTRKGNMLYIDEFQVYTTPGFADMLTQGRSYRVASHLATQARDQIAMGGGKDGKGFVTVVDANARNKIVYPGSFSDGDFYSKQFGEIIEMETKQTKAYSTLAGAKGLFADRVSESTSEVKKVRFSSTDIVFRPFGEITYCIIKNNSIQPPGVSKIQYIPKELNELLDKMVAEYNEEQERKSPGVMADINTNKNKKDYDVNGDLNHGDINVNTDNNINDNATSVNINKDLNSNSNNKQFMNIVPEEIKNILSSELENNTQIENNIVDTEENIVNIPKNDIKINVSEMDDDDDI